ncbi:hypothetical protein DCAR_0417584 [Daucus carota subsp. sativus]|uniref:Uncharacterized protein n=1 Tax=Daucus carota subsp. sativus TaxID=79200 RepID=A0A165YSE7_DAUCS|nr:hypothetical protein DCAR_0417584 [Daucus carota subsp. sativus]
MSDISKGSEICEQVLNLPGSFLMSVEDVFVEYDDAQTAGSEDIKRKDVGSTVTLNGYVIKELEDDF